MQINNNSWFFWVPYNPNSYWQWVAVSDSQDAYFLQSHIEKSSAVATDISKTQALGHPHKFIWKNTTFWVSVLGIVQESELDCFNLFQSSD